MFLLHAVDRAACPGAMDSGQTVDQHRAIAGFGHGLSESPLPFLSGRRAVFRIPFAQDDAVKIDFLAAAKLLLPEVRRGQPELVSLAQAYHRLNAIIVDSVPQSTNAHLSAAIQNPL